MKIRHYAQLEKTFDDRTFEGKYGLLDNLLFVSSYLGNIASIFFAYWFLSSLLYKATSEFPGRAIGIAMISVSFLVIFELLKRFVLKNLSLSIIQSKKKITTEVIYNVVFSLILLSGSFYSSLSGAKIFSDKRDIVEHQIEIDMTSQVDSINGIYSEKIKYKIEERNELRKSRDIYNENLKDAKYTSRLKEYNSLLKQANEELRRTDVEISEIKQENKRDLEFIRSELQSSSDKQISQISKNQLAFVIISSFIEFLILVGIWFHSIFRLKVYQEYRQDIETNINYQTYTDYSKMLKILYQNGKIQPQGKLPAISAFITTVRKREKNFSQNYVRDFMTLCKDLGLISIGGSKKENLVLKSYETSKEEILDYFEE